MFNENGLAISLAETFVGGVMNNTIRKTYEILGLIGESKERGLSLSEIVLQTGLPKSSVFDIVKSLYELNLLSVNQYNDKKYVLGIATFELGSKFTQDKTLVATCQQYLLPIADRLGQTAFIAMLNGGNIIYIYKYQAENATLASCKVGSSHLAYTTALGKSLLSYIDEESLNAIIQQYTFDFSGGNTIHSKEELLAQIADCRKNGYAIDLQENEITRVCYGAPIFNAQGKPIAAISISDLKRKDVDHNSYGEIIRDCAIKISHELGYPEKQYWAKQNILI